MTVTDGGGLVVGWRAIGEALGRPSQSLAQAHSHGRLPVVPLKIGATVAMTPQMLDAMRSSPARARK
jgi:hypothetical protein